MISDQTPWNTVNDRGAGRALSLNAGDAWRKALQEFIEFDAVAWRAYSERAQKMVSARQAASETMLKVYFS